MLSLKTKLGLLALACVLAMVGYLTWGLNPKFLEFALQLRVPKLLAMSLAAVCIGGASLIFQTLINNYMVTPCLLGMNSLYVLLHTLLVFTLGMGSFVITNKNLAFICDLALMGTVAVALYSYLFAKTRYNVLYVLLIGTVLTTFLTSVQSTIVRTMDPNDYDALLTTLVASFDHVNHEVLALAAGLTVLLTVVSFRQLKLLNVMALGRVQALSLGVNYDQSLRFLLLYVTLLIAIATALVGPISFMGLITTNVARQLFKTYRHRYLIAGSMLFTLLILIAGQMVIERIFVYSIPISVIITIAGGSYFLYLIVRGTKLQRA